MNPEEAARRLDAELRRHSWYSSVGTGRTPEGPALFLYVKTGKHRELSRLGDEWMGYRLIIRPVGRIRAVA